MSISSADLEEEEEALHALTQAEKRDVNEEEEQESEVAPIINAALIKYSKIHHNRDVKSTVNKIHAELRGC